MKFTGGYDIPLAGKPDEDVDFREAPDVLHLPLWTRRFVFTELEVEHGQEVEAGQPLARATESHNMPLIAPRDGTVDLEAVEEHVTLREVGERRTEPIPPETVRERMPERLKPAPREIGTLMELGAWQYLAEGLTGEVPDPIEVPRAVVISTLNSEPFSARGDVQLSSHMDAFRRGLERIQDQIEYAPIYVAVPETESELGADLRKYLRGRAWVHGVTVPSRYPGGDLELLSQELVGGSPSDGPIWGLMTAGVLAIERTLNERVPCDTTLTTIGGPAAEKPRHILAPIGYPLELLVGDAVQSDEVRVVCGGVMNGPELHDIQKGLHAGCTGLTLLEEHEGRELLSWMRPGADRNSYSNCFLSSVWGEVEESLTTALRGEKRPCVSCNYCSEVCPVDIRPQQIHKYLYNDALEEVEAARVDLCIGCGLCSYVCPSKIELRSQMLDAQEQVRRELHPEEEAE